MLSFTNGESRFIGSLIFYQLKPLRKFETGKVATLLILNVFCNKGIIPEGGTPTLDLTRCATHQGVLLWKRVQNRVSFSGESYRIGYYN